MKKSSNDTSGIFVVEFLLKTETWHEHRIDKIMNILTDYYRQKQRFLLAKYNEYLATTEEGKALTETIKERESVFSNTSSTEEDKKAVCNKVNTARKAFHNLLNGIKYETANYGYFSKMGCYMHFSNSNHKNTATRKMLDEHGINSSIKEYLGKDCAGSAWDKKLKTNNKDIKIDVNKTVNMFKSRKKSGSIVGFRFSTVEHTITMTDIKSKNGTPMTIPFIVNPKSVYEKEALEKEVRCIAIVRKQIRGNNKYYVQFTFAGHPCNKGRNMGLGTLSIDPSLCQIITLSIDKNICRTYSLADTVTEDVKKINKLQRMLDSIRRTENPDNYNLDGTIKNQAKLVWKESDRYKMLKCKLADMWRKYAVKRKICHNKLANELIANYNIFKVEKNSYKSMQARSKEIKKDKNGRCLSKKRYGKSIKNHAPSMFFEILKNKVGHYQEGKYIEVPTGSGCTAYDFTNGEFTKHNVNERTIRTSDGQLHDRDAHATFNIYYYKETKESKKKVQKSKENFDNVAMKAAYHKFMTLEAPLLAAKKI